MKWIKFSLTNTLKLYQKIFLIIYGKPLSDYVSQKVWEHWKNDATLELHNLLSLNKEYYSKFWIDFKIKATC